MKKIFLLLAFFSVANNISAQNIGIGTTTPNANAALEIKSNSKGLLMPRLSTTARSSMTNVAKGMLVYDTTRAGFYYHDGGKWLSISQSNTDSLFRYTYPGVAPAILSMPPYNNVLIVDDLHGTLYDNGGQAGNYATNSDDQVVLSNFNNDSIIQIKIEVVQMDLESPYDSLEIYFSDDYEHKQLFTGNRTGIFYFAGGTDYLVFRFRSNGVNNLSGYKINWTKITTNSQNAEPPPQTGWYFNSAKIAARAGININNNWVTDSLGRYSFAVGKNAVAKGTHSNAIGYSSAALGIVSTSIGFKNIAGGSYATALGSNNMATGNYTTAIGSENIANNFGATAIGTRSRASGYMSSVIGHELISKNPFSFIVGLLNDTTVFNSLFEIGNGTGNNSRLNAVTVLRNGNTGIGTSAPTTQLEVNGGIKTKYSGSVIKSVTGTGSAALVNLTIPALPDGWDFTNTLVMVSAADGVTGIIYQTKLTSTKNIQLYFEANATGPIRFNYIVFKL